MDKLKKFEYTIPECCSFCTHVSGGMYNVILLCELNDATVHSSGVCLCFEKDEKRYTAVIAAHMLTRFMNKRKYTRNNRHKAKTSY